MWLRECEQSIHVQQPRGLSLGEKAKTFLGLERKSWSWLKPWQSQGQDFSLKAKAKAKTWGAKTKAKIGQDLVIQGQGQLAKTFMRCPRGSSRSRPGVEDNKTGLIIAGNYSLCRSRFTVDLSRFFSTSEKVNFPPSSRHSQSKWSQITLGWVARTVPPLAIGLTLIVL